LGKGGWEERDFLWRADIAGWLNETAREKLTEKEAQESRLSLSLSLSLCRRVLGASTPARDRFFICLSLSLSLSLSFPLERRTSLNDVFHLISENAGANAHRESNIAMHRVSSR